MKKTYMAPQMEQMEMKEVMPLCASGSDDIKSGGIVEDVLFGGKDEDGIINPDIKQFINFGDGLNGLLF